MPVEMRTFLEPVRKSVTVPRPPGEAFEIFTAGIGSWWPLRTYSISQERAVTCAFEPRAGGALYEISESGERFPWGTVLVWEPPHRLVMTWHPGRAPETAQEVEVSFSAVPGGTRVDLEHRNWQAWGEGAEESRAGYDGEDGWGTVLGVRYRAACAGLATGPAAR